MMTMTKKNIKLLVGVSAVQQPPGIKKLVLDGWTRWLDVKYTYFFGPYKILHTNLIQEEFVKVMLCLVLSDVGAIGMQ